MSSGCSEPRVIPALLLQDGQFVKTRAFEDPIYVGDPINILSIFNDFEVDEIVILDIRAARDRVPAPFEDLRRYAEECFIPLAYGGGLTSIEQLRQLFDTGYEKAVLNSALADAPEFVEAAATTFGSQSVVASIDVVTSSVGEEQVVVHGGADVVGQSPVEWARRAVDLGVGEILLTSVNREGTGQGYDLDLVSKVRSVVNIPVIAHGGAGSREDLAQPVLLSGASAVAAGKLFVFQGPDRGVLVNYLSRNQIKRLFSNSSSGT